SIRNAPKARTKTGKKSKARRTSRPGEPPKSHTGLLKRFIFFSYDPQADSVVIGPTKLNQKSADVLAALEYGGASTNTKGERVAIEARPFMGPAFASELPQLPRLWANSVK